jgi:hypothetical protein
MTWRPWIISGLGIVALLLNGLLVVQEDLPQVIVDDDPEKIIEPLRTLTYAPNTRRQNFEQAMGLPPEVANAAAVYAQNLSKQRNKWWKVLELNQDQLGAALCPSKDLPQPYAMLRFLVVEDAGRRYVIEAGRTKVLEPQPWFEESVVPSLYDHFERTERRKGDATVMAVSAAMLAMETEALDGQAPWSMGVLGAWSYGRLESQHPKLRKFVIEYFGLMHYLTELANESRGICS